jgi:transcriptional regulator with XRE-family HTH domain
LAERALKSRAESTAATVNSKAELWPPASRRIREARLQTGLSEAEAAEQAHMNLPSYWDLEHFDDEAFSVISLAELKAVGQLLGVEPRVVLLGSGATMLKPAVTFAEIAARLAERVSRDGCSVEEFGQQIGWDIGPVLADSAALWDFNVEGLHDICQTVDLDWVAALPSLSARPD